MVGSVAGHSHSHRAPVSSRGSCGCDQFTLREKVWIVTSAIFGLGVFLLLTATLREYASSSAQPTSVGTAFLTAIGGGAVTITGAVAFRAFIVGDV